MSLFRVVLQFGIAAGLMFLLAPTSSEAACACSRVGQSTGYYAAPSGANYGSGVYVQGKAKGQPVSSKTGKAKKKNQQKQPTQ